jgi:hypothetical protein
MLRVLACLLIVTAQLPGAAPDTIAGKVYRDSIAIVSLRGASESTLLFQTDGRFVSLKGAGVNFVGQGFAGGKLLLGEPRPDGAYKYRRTGDSTGTVELQFDDGASRRIDLNFTSISEGYLGLSAASPDGTFLLSDLAAIQSAPARNLSMRGRVGPGQPLVVGFVIPGSRRADTGLLSVQSGVANERDILIRAVGPSLAPLGVSSSWADPDFRIYQGAGQVSPMQYHYPDWSVVPATTTGEPGPNPGGVAGFRKIFGYVGAFPLLDGSKDAASVVRLAPGAYTIVAEPGTSDPGGEVLIEVYFLP